MDLKKYTRSNLHFYSGEASPLILKYLKMVRWKSFLDMGCGDGSLLYSLNKKGLLDKKNVFAIDLEKDRIQEARRINSRFKCFVDDACDVKNLDDASIDFIVSRAVIEHVESDKKMVREMERILKKNGYLYLMTIIKKWYGWYFYRCNGRWVLDPTHVREYSEERELLDMLKENGFRILVNVKSQYKRSVVTNIFLKLISRNRETGDSKAIKILRKLKFPIPGYLYWEIVCRKIG